MKRLQFIGLVTNSIFIASIKRKFSFFFKPTLTAAWPASSYPNLPVAATDVRLYPVIYSPAGIGGGGAYGGYAISPYNGLRLVGTDMGTLFRSPNSTKTWYPIPHRQA